MSSEMDWEIRQQKRQIDRNARRAEKERKDQALFVAAKLESHHQFALQFINWTERAGIGPNRLPATTTWSNRERLTGWIVDQTVHAGKVLTYTAVTTDGRYVKVGEHVDLQDELYGTIREHLARFVASNRPDIPWNDPATPKKKFKLFG